MMDVFMVLINILEATIFTYFVTAYFKLSKTYFWITSIIHFLILTFFSMINNEGFILSLIIVFFMIASVIIAKKKVNFHYFYIIIVYESLLLCSNFCGVALLNIFASFNVPMNISIVILNILVKMILVGITYLLLKFKNNIMISLDVKKWFLVILFEIMMISAISMLTYELFLQKYSLYLSLVLLVLLNVMSLLFIIIIYRIHLMNLNIVENSRLEQLKKFNEEKLNTINHIKNNIDSLEHRMFYVLLKIKYSIEKNDLTTANKMIDLYINSITKNKFIMNTDNVIFDSIIGLKINELKLAGVDTNISIFISKNSFYDQLFFIHMIIQLLDQYLQVKYLNLQIEQMEDYVKIKFIHKNGNISIEKIKEILDSIKKIDYNFDNYEENGIRLLLRMEENEKDSYQYVDSQ